MIALIKAVLGALGAIFGYFKDRQLIDAGKAEQANENAQATLDAVAAVAVPITDDDRKRVWDRLQTKYGPKPSVPTDPVA
jgi:membrane glycosyltransferase